jgi:hypothetical protein
VSRAARFDDVIPGKRDYKGVILAMEDFDKEMPAIWLEPAEGKVLSIDYKTWAVFGRTT